MSKQAGDYIELYPGNWLYNAGVVGLLRVLSKHEKTDELFSLEDECVRIKTEMFEKIRKDKDTSRIKLVPFWHYWYILESRSAIGDRSKKKWKAEEKGKEKKSKITISEGISYEFKKNEEDKNKIMEVIEKNLGKPTREFVESFIDAYGYLFFKLYRNLSPTGEYNIDEFIKKVGNIEKIKSESPTPTNNNFCSFCNSSEYKLEPISVKYMNLLMPSYNEFPNSHWNCSADGIDMICSLCQFIITHHHLAFTKIHDGSEIFINAPSFKLMYELNKLVKEVYSSNEKSKSVRKILGMTLIQYAGRLWSNLGKWSQMNIEVAIRKGDAIDFYSLPYHTVNILSDTKIAILVRSIDESKILDYIISGKHEKILRSVYREMREYFSDKAKNKRPKLNSSKLRSMLKLYSAIKERGYGR